MKRERERGRERTRDIERKIVAAADRVVNAIAHRAGTTCDDR